jgi:hypothetical protein
LGSRSCSKKKLGSRKGRAWAKGGRRAGRERHWAGHSGAEVLSKKKKRGGLLISQQEAFGYEANAQQEKKCSRIERGIFF